MALRPASLPALLMLLAGCTASTPQVLPKAASAPVRGIRGTILAMRPVTAEPAGPARIVLSGLAVQDTVVDDHAYEFIVRTESGTTISVVQPRISDLHAGERVSILPGAETRIDALTD
jgi:outer membrane lipoprotein SlyB